MNTAQQRAASTRQRRVDSALVRMTLGLTHTYYGAGASVERALGTAVPAKEPSSEILPCDDDKDDYIFRANEVWQNRFRIIRKLGKGSFGQVFEAFDLHTRDASELRTVAIKVIKNRKSFYNQALLEIRILQLLNSKDPKDDRHIVRMKGHFVHRNHLCIVYEILSHNLYEVVKAGAFTGLAMHWIKKIARQLLESLELLCRSDVQVIHCDLKPENILLRGEFRESIKVIDFGSSCFLKERAYSYIQSRFYRSPEVILGHHYSMAIDIWSLGCILFELYTGEPLFNGQNENDQLLKIIDLLGMPPNSFIRSGTPAKVNTMFSVDPLPPQPASIRTRSSTAAAAVAESNRSYRAIIPPHFQPRGTRLGTLLHQKFQQRLQTGQHTAPESSSSKLDSVTPAVLARLHVYEAAATEFEAFQDLLGKMLVYEPRERITPDVALKHPFFKRKLTERETNTVASSGFAVMEATPTRPGGLVGNF